MSLLPERRLSSATLGGIFLGLMMCFFGFPPQAGSDQPLPIWVWRTVGYGGVILIAFTIPARVARKEWARRLVIAGLGITVIPLGLLFAYSVAGGRFNPFTLLLALGVLGCWKGIGFYNSADIRGCFGGPSLSPADPAPAISSIPQGPNRSPDAAAPSCPNCKVPLSGAPKFCPSCGFPVRGTRMRWRWLWTLTIVFVAPFLMNRMSGNKPKVLPASGSMEIVSSEITVAPHSTYWSAVEPKIRGEAVFQVTARETEVGMNFGLIGDEGFTPKLDELMRDTQTDVDPGKQNEMVFSVETNRKYAAFVINETDVPAKAQIKLSMRWGPPK